MKMMRTKCLIILVIVLICIMVSPISRGYQVKFEKVVPTTTSLITMLQPGYDPEIADVHAKYIDKNTGLWGIDRDDFVSVINKESSFNSMAESTKGAKGASQILIRVHKELVKKRRLMPHEIWYLDNNYSMGCEVFYMAKKKSHNLDEILTRYVGGKCPGYIPDIKKSIAKCRAMTDSRIILM